MALMLRYLGIPSRVAVGFASGNYQHGEWVVSDRDAHMWVEVWFRGWGWVPFDPTPGRGGLAGSYSASSPSFDITAATAVLAGKEGFGSSGTRWRTRSASARRRAPRRTCRSSAASRSGRRSTSHHRRDWGILRLLALALAGAVVLLVLAKLLRRGSRFLTRDPRRLAGACRERAPGLPARPGRRRAGQRDPARAGGARRIRVPRRGRCVRPARDRCALRARATAPARRPAAMRRDLRALRRGMRRALSSLRARARAALAPLARPGLGRGRGGQVRFT